MSEGSTSTRWRLSLWVLLIAASVGMHVVAFPLLDEVVRAWESGLYASPTAVRFVDPSQIAAPSMESLRSRSLETVVATENTLTEPETEQVPEPEPPKLPDGQIVETPPPNEERIPLDADYLAEHNNAVPDEMRSRDYAINPEVLSDVYSETREAASEALPDVGAEVQSTGAQVGTTSEALSAGNGAPRTLLPSEWRITNRPGDQNPTLGGATSAQLSGAPQNDLLAEKVGDRVALNTLELLGAQYLNRIRRQVNFYWDQNLRNLPPSVRLSAPRYLTEVKVTLDGNGALDDIVVTNDSGNVPVDNCVVEAFKVAGPFPNPPRELVAKDGRVYLPDFNFTVEVGHASMQYRGVDPRAGVQFPGIMKAPR